MHRINATAPPPDPEPAEELLVDLAKAGIDYAVVGGVAVSLNGFVRATDDVDIILLKADSWREKDRTDVGAMRRILEQERRKS